MESLFLAKAVSLITLQILIILIIYPNWGAQGFSQPSGLPTPAEHLYSNNEQLLLITKKPQSIRESGIKQVKDQRKTLKLTFLGAQLLTVNDLPPTHTHTENEFYLPQPLRSCERPQLCAVVIGCLLCSGGGHSHWCQHRQSPLWN